MSWFILSLLTAGISAIVNLVDKHLLIHYVKSPIVAVKILGIFNLVAIVGLILFWSGHIISLFGLGLPLIAGFFEVLYIYFYLKAINKAEVAYMVPIFALAPVFTLFISLVFMKGQLVLLPSVGVFVIIIGIILLVIGKQGDFRTKPDKSFFFMVLAALLYGFHTIFFSLGLKSFSLYDNIMFSRAGVIIGALVILVFARSINLGELRSVKPYFFIISEMLYFVSVWVFLLALSKGVASYVIGVVNIQPLFVFGASYFLWRFFPKILQEQFTFRKPYFALISIIVIIVGATMLNQ